MNIVVLDGYTLNPGDLSWDNLQKLGDCTIYERTAKEDVYSRIKDAEIVLTNKAIVSKEAPLIISVRRLSSKVLVALMDSALGFIDTNKCRSLICVGNKGRLSL